MRRTRIVRILDGVDPRVGRWPALVISALILISAVSIALETMPQLPESLRTALHWVELSLLAGFTLEYAIRLICSPRPWRYATSFWGIVDFLACVPAILFLFPDVQSVRLLRLLRLARVLKLFRASRSLDRLAFAYRAVRGELLVFLFMASLVLYLAAVGIYHFEHAAQPDVFTSIPESLWWAVVTLTTVGYGDAYPVTVGGRLFTGLVLLAALGVVAVPAGLITSALLSPEPERQAAARWDDEHRDPD